MTLLAICTLLLNLPFTALSVPAFPYKISPPALPAHDLESTATVTATELVTTTIPTSLSSTSDTVLKYIPPPKIDVTPALIQQALSQQPQNTATIHCAIPFLADGVIQYCVQMEGLIADSFMMNASTTIPRGLIGEHPNITLVIVPKTIEGGTRQLALETAQIIAVNMAHSGSIAYWVQLDNGTIVTLSSDSVVHDIDLIDPNAPAELTILTSTPEQPQSYLKRHASGPQLGLRRATPILKRNLESSVEIAQVDHPGERGPCKTLECGPGGWYPYPIGHGQCLCLSLKRARNRDSESKFATATPETDLVKLDLALWEREAIEERGGIYVTACSNECRPGYTRSRLENASCLCQKPCDNLKNTDCLLEPPQTEKQERGLEEVNTYTVVMSPEACAAMTCNNNDGSKPMYHPFTKSCFCWSKEYLGVASSGEGAIHSKD